MSYEKCPEKARPQHNECYLTVDGKPTLFTPDVRRLGQVMLFDMPNDPWETRNLAGDPQYRPVIAEHETLLAQHEAPLIAGKEFTRK
jgi:hypothetical protein